jgi:hypothetical protein
MQCMVDLGNLWGLFLGRDDGVVSENLFLLGSECVIDMICVTAVMAYLSVRKNSFGSECVARDDRLRCNIIAKLLSNPNPRVTSCSCLTRKGLPVV